MKKLIMLLSVLALCSCVSVYYQTSELKANSAFIKNNNVYEDSTFKITYNFWAVGGILKFDIYNKLSIPIYIDWNRSNFILNGKSSTYTENGSAQHAMTGQGVAKLAMLNGSEYYVSIPNTEQINTQIPPHSYISVNRFNFNVPYYSIGYYPKKRDSTEYNYDNSILHFRNYIGYTTKQDLSNLKLIDNEFWVSKVTTISGRYFNESTVIPCEFYTTYLR